MVTKKQMLELANKGNWDYIGGENRCQECGEYQFTGKHKVDCSLGILLQLIERSCYE